MIRAAKANDATAIALLSTSIPELNGESFSEKEIKEFIKKGIVFVEENSTLVGVVLGRIEGEHAELIGLLVLPQHRKEGIGSELVNAFEEFAVKKGCKLVSVLADPAQILLFKLLDYREGRTQTLFRKRL